MAVSRHRAGRKIGGLATGEARGRDIPAKGASGATSPARRPAAAPSSAPVKHSAWRALDGAAADGGACPAVSIVIITDGRAEPLANALASLRFLRYPRFEVVVVAGPTADGTRELLERWRGNIKIGSCPERNISRARNIGIGIASGEILAFLDDDAVPEPEWLDDIVPLFADPVVGAAGGLVHDHTGKTYQCRFETADRFGTARTDWQWPTPEYNFPMSFNFPIAVGTNSLFRRGALVDVGGFDEEFGYYLDETDLICRLVDRGWHLTQSERGFVHHKYMPSRIRNRNRFLTSWYALVKSKTYFSLANGSRHRTTAQILAEIQRWIVEFRDQVAWGVVHGMLVPDDVARFDAEADQGLRDGLVRGLAGVRRLVEPQRLRGEATGFLPFRPLLPAGQQRCFVMLSAAYPPGSFGGIGRYVSELARAMAAMGHQLHVLTRGESHDRVDFEDGVWVHRIVPREFPPPHPDPELGVGLPQHIWNHSMTMLAEAKEIAARRPIDAVHAPIWDVEGIAFLRDGSMPLVTTLHTTLASYLDSNPHLRADRGYSRNFAAPMLAAERELLTGSDALLANSAAIVAAIESAYGVPLGGDRLRVVPHGLEDWHELPHVPPDGLPPDMVRLVFVGRLEPRKGFDVLMGIAPELMTRHPEVWLDIVGDDQVSGPNGQTWRQMFETDPAIAALRSRVAFHGEVNDARLRGFYRAADVVLAPSRFESFGLVHLEALMLGRPVIGCRAGGMVEVIDDGRTGLLAEPGDGASLRSAIERLLADREQRERLGAAARADYLERFTAARMAADETAVLCAAAGGKRAASKCWGGRKSGREAPEFRPTTLSARPTGPPRIAIVGGVVARYDAISQSVADSWHFLSRGTGWEVSVLTLRNDDAALPARLVGDVAELLFAPEFLSADLLIYHFGVWSPVFDALLVGNGRARQAAFFHNITPTELDVPAGHATSQRSFRQLENLRHADRLWPVSETNAALLAAHGFDRDRIEVVPLAVGAPAIRRLADKAPTPIELLFLGRIVPAKGVADLLAAVASLRGRELPDFRLRIAGNLEYSDAGYCDSVRRTIRDRRLDDIVEFIGTVDDARRDRLLHAAHILVIPSYHEGFCKPVIEGLRAGCVPVGYAAHHLRYIADGLCRMVTPGEIAALAEALAEIIVDVAAALASSSARLRLDRGRLNRAEFSAAVLEHVDSLRPGRVAALMRERVGALLSGSGRIEPPRVEIRSP